MHVLYEKAQKFSKDVCAHVKSILLINMVTGMITVSILNKAFKHEYVAAQDSLCVL